jgi:hypothetical protein
MICHKDVFSGPYLPVLEGIIQDNPGVLWVIFNQAAYPPYPVFTYGHYRFGKMSFDLERLIARIRGGIGKGYIPETPGYTAITPG